MLKIKLQGYLGKPDDMISLLVVGLQGASKKRSKRRDVVAIERFKLSNGSWFYLETSLPVGLKPANIRAYLSDARRSKSSESNEERWNQGIKDSRSKRDATFRTSTTTDYTSLISGDLNRKTLSTVRKIIKQAEASNLEFMKCLV